MPRVSILMPVYNGMPYVPEAIESVLSQDCSDWELVISDNGSTDGTRDYLRTLDDERIVVHLQASNLGIFGNLNFLFANCRTEVAKILCADDKLLPGGLQSVLQFMDDHPSCAISRCLAEGQREAYAAEGKLALQGALPGYLAPRAATLAFATFGNLVGNLSRAACRPRLVMKAGGFDQRYPYAGDYEAWGRTAAIYGVHLQNEEHVFERSHELQNSNLLNRRNELFPQINQLLEHFASQVSPRDLALLKRHWTVHFLAQRTPRYLRQLCTGHFGLAASVWAGLPLRISPLACLMAYPLTKLNFSIANGTTRKLLERIVASNLAEST